MIAVIYLKKHVTGSYIFGIFLYKLSHWQEFCLVIQFEIDKDTQVYLYYTVLALDLAICLEIEYGLEFLFNIEKVVEQ